MLITIDHETIYRYDSPVSYSIQSLRLTPQPFDGQSVRYWRVTSTVPAQFSSFQDSFGNVTQTLVIDRPYEENCIRVQGVVDTVNTHGVVSGAVEPFPAMFYLRETEQTRPDGAIRALAKTVQATADTDVDCMHKMMLAIRNAIEYQTGESHAQTTAIEVMSQGVGVCQDHAHVFIACARSIGIPARYVSGYLLHTETGEVTQASHAWAEVMIPELGWIGFDVANRVCTTDQYVRIGVGLDYREAAPIRGIRRGGESEELSVKVRVSQSQSAAQ
ncbi:MAG: transglutaminase [Kordiimonas sp.]|nr:transglutaminase [Kordiimonas sp.]|tara:strand:- start:3308 stop:4129 length:822 start_codon:yes stop_codon:yes gene_type:complete